MKRKDSNCVGILSDQGKAATDSNLNEYNIDPFPKRHRLVHNGGFTKFEALCCSLNMVNATEISLNLSYKVQSSKSQNLKQVQKL